MQSLRDLSKQLREVVEILQVFEETLNQGTNQAHLSAAPDAKKDGQQVYYTLNRTLLKRLPKA